MATGGGASWLSLRPPEGIGGRESALSPFQLHTTQKKEEHMRLPFLSKRGPTAEDPVCHMKVDTSKPPGGTWEHAGATYYFCGPGCNRAFQKEPEAYRSGEKKLDM